ncbi:MAG: acyltransferase, partial [Bacteroidota bacterium]|nr:acyltransferase [Bacteroidota bacterium]
MNRVPEIDGLRGIAILMIVSFHYINNQLVASQNLFGKMLYFSTSFGWAGVDLFFVLSGYLIGSILLRTRTSPYYLQTFFVRRFLRIIPNYYLLLVIIFIVFNSSFFQSNTFLSGN